MALTRRDIARSGLRLLNEVGLNGLTLRLIAGDLGVKAPALYWHVKNKQELLDEMATQMLADATAERVPPEGLDAWQRLEHQARSLRDALLTYRDGAKVFSGTFLTDLSVVGPFPLQERVDAGADPVRAARAHFAVYSFVIGFTIEEQAVYPVRGRRDERYGAEDPGSAVLADPDAGFSDGLAIVLTGARQWVDGPSPQVGTS
ncbi:TetR/AcrR family transcriptional regulator C-terminal domain-containing protein [Amycolatopsis rhabdoformis]|uniref:TetR/AcrR family transcriptional regulator C-terminal domain-containing protein n=1 Tax=Amycolatopsis rhabdoformis TaxID=1448059 RepID=A0ABZ1I5E9_9PSEU|nr:TetR/AcrR family transcriptional regulator C-terminal domain-containing protein [Amycolatopsis rhabdoformis]WSE29647.1 TetR/AcrR family transcriptional regulator C-terminal domain-containing protein [Amycolatopsis rhabdoformis]